MIIKNFRNILKSLKKIIKCDIFFKIVNNYFKHENYFFNNFNFFLIYKNNDKVSITNNKSYVNLYFLENIGNIQSCIRTCFIFSIYCILRKKNENFINFYNNCIFVNNIDKIIKKISKNNICYTATTKAKITINKIKNKKKFLLNIGNEKKSIKKKFFFSSDLILKIRTYCKKSLNVSVGSGIILYKLNE